MGHDRERGGLAVLLEREAHLASLRGYAADARRGEGRLVLIAGEAGAGKSALVEQACTSLPSATWSWGACDGLFTPRPLGPLFDIAESLGGDLRDLCRSGAPREELFSALLRQVGASPGAELNVLVIEDAHWADEATIDLLRFLGRRIRSAPVLLLVTYRDEGLTATDPLRMALGDLATQRPVRRLSLPPLSPDAVALLAAGSGLDPAQLYRLTGGNPFYVTQAVQAGVNEVPPSARDAVLARAARLSRPARMVLDVAALIGARAEVALLEQVTACSPAAIDELLASGLLTGDSLAGGGMAVQFRHEIARLAVEATVAVHRRRASHARILAALGERQRGDDPRMAFHAEAAGDAPAALRHATAAARRAAELGAHREAVAQFERALRCVGDADPRTIAGLYEGFAREASLLNRFQDAADAYGPALALWRQIGDRRREGDTLRLLGLALGRLHRGEEAVASIQAAVQILEPLGPTAELGWAYTGLAARWTVRGRNEEAIELARRARAIAGPLGLTELTSDALNSEASAVHELGGDWAGLMRQAVDAALAGRHQREAGRAYRNMHAAYVTDRNWRAAQSCYTEAIAYCDDHDIPTYSALLRSEHACVLERTGNWDEAVALCEQLLADEGLPPHTRFWPLIFLGVIRARQGEAAAGEHLDQAMSDVAGSGDRNSIVPARLARAEALWLAGNLEGAQAEAEAADDVADGCDEWERGAVAVWLRRTGSARPPRGKVAAPFQRQLESDWDGAARLWTELGCPYEAGLALLGLTGEASLREALRIFTSLGAKATMGVTQLKMRRLGIRSIPAGPRPATRRSMEHPLGLTRREQEVLGLIVGGLTNAEIAAKLFISAKTVEHHVSAILAKLGVPSRGAAATWAQKLGPAPLPDLHRPPSPRLAGYGSTSQPRCQQPPLRAGRRPVNRRLQRRGRLPGPAQPAQRVRAGGMPQVRPVQPVNRLQRGEHRGRAIPLAHRHRPVEQDRGVSAQRHHQVIQRNDPLPVGRRPAGRGAVAGRQVRLQLVRPRHAARPPHRLRQ
jgi:DNA-binding CsgD family transcriptional regulator/tetratricopeptide (TPR) repeat protein